VSASLESIDKLNMKLKHDHEREERKAKTGKNVLVDVVNGGFTKRSPRNSILPYSVFEDYLLFKCYLDKSDENSKNNVRTRQSGHLGIYYLLFWRQSHASFF
jgi:hypothetical protein